MKRKSHAKPQKSRQIFHHKVTKDTKVGRTLFIWDVDQPRLGDRDIFYFSSPNFVLFVSLW